MSITDDKTHLSIDRRHCSDYGAHREWLISARVHKIAQWPNMCRCKCRYNIYIAREKHKGTMLSSKTWPTLSILIFAASTTSSRTKKNAVNTILWGCGLCLVVSGNEVMIGVKYWVGRALVGTAQPKHRYSLFHFISVNECPKNYNICDTEYGKGWLAIAKLKPLSLFISLFQNCQMLS